MLEFNWLLCYIVYVSDGTCFSSKGAFPNRRLFELGGTLDTGFCMRCMVILFGQNFVTILCTYFKRVHVLSVM